MTQFLPTHHQMLKHHFFHHVMKAIITHLIPSNSLQRVNAELFKCAPSVSLSDQLSKGPIHKETHCSVAIVNMAADVSLNRLQCDDTHPPPPVYKREGLEPEAA